MTMVNEAQRQFYLGRMGVRLWYARSVQPGAAPSPDFDFEDMAPASVWPETAAPAVSSPDSADTGRKAGLANLRGLMDGPRPDIKVQVTKPESRLREAVPDPPIVPSREQPETPAEAEPEAVSPDSPSVSPAPVRELPGSAVLSVNWGVWMSESYVLVSAISTDASADLQHALARSILGAMGMKAGPPKMLQWPVFSNPAVPGNDESGLRELLKELATRFPPNSLIALGLCQDESWDDRSGWLEASLGMPVVDFEFSLAALATDPGRKRALWSRLRPLVAG
ncbi:hypothetical protein [Marinobacter sp.]|uniref:hypothetical protein n=1 Tax=Marinobacter sp. TaxID=50741 RepID=UPI00384CB770